MLHSFRVQHPVKKMQLLESIEVLNQRLLDHFGKFKGTINANWRVVYSEEQYEKRLSSYTPEGMELLQPQVQLLPKYKQWIHNKYILERCVPVPEMNRKELISQTSFEPVWVFEDGAGNPLPPKWEVIVFVIDSVYRESARVVGVKYEDPDRNPEEAIENRVKRLAALHQELFGNETTVTDALAHNQGIVVPNNYEVH